MKYIFPTSSHTTEHLQQLERPIHSALLPKCGYNRNMSCAIRFGTRTFGGAGFLPFQLLQGEAQILLFLKSWRTNGTESTLLRIALAWAQAQTGTSYPILTNVSIHLPQLEAQWIPSLRSFLHQIKATIELDNDYRPSLQREGDMFIIDKVLQNPRFTPQQMQQINYCRQYLQVHTLSDVCQANGKQIDIGNIHGNLHQCTNRYRWLPTNQAKPDNSSWKIWTSAISIWFTLDGLLHNSLGKWLHPASQLRRSWSSYWYPGNNTIIIAVANGFH